MCLCKVAAPLVSAAHDQAGGFGASLEPLRTSAPGVCASISASTATSTEARESTSASAVLTTSHWQPQATADAKQLRNEGAAGLDFGVSATAASNSSLKPVPTAGQAQATAAGGPSGAQMNVTPTLSSARATVPSPSPAPAHTAALNSTEHDAQSSDALEVPDGDDSEVELEAIVDVLPDQDGDSASDNDD